MPKKTTKENIDKKAQSYKECIAKGDIEVALARTKNLQRSFIYLQRIVIEKVQILQERQRQTQNPMAAISNANKGVNPSCFKRSNGTERTLSS